MPINFKSMNFNQKVDKRWPEEMNQEIKITHNQVQFLKHDDTTFHHTGFFLSWSYSKPGLWKVREAGASMVEYWVKPLPVTLASHMRTSLIPVCSTSNPTPTPSQWGSWEGNGCWPKRLSLRVPVRSWDSVADCWLQPGPALALQPFAVKMIECNIPRR